MTGYAFFDVDETIIRFKSMFLFDQFYCMNAGFMPHLFGAGRHQALVSTVQDHLKAGRSREFINSLYYRNFKGRRQSTVRDLVARFYGWVAEKQGASIYFPAVRAIVDQHRQEGTRIVLVSGSFIDLLTPLAEELGVYRVLATTLEVQDDTYTGNIVPPQMIGVGKALAVRTLLAEEGASRAQAWAYGDHVSDVAMLEEVDNPIIVSRDPQMISLAAERGWGLVDPLTEYQEFHHA